MLDPQSFVRHLHTDRENQTCHWGFDASHWRSYVHISDVYYKSRTEAAAVATDLSPDKAQALLDEIKKRFNHHPKLHRKQVSEEAPCAMAHKVSKNACNSLRRRPSLQKVAFFKYIVHNYYMSRRILSNKGR